MKEFADLLSVYLSAGSGMVVLWFSLYGGFPLGESIVRALVVGAVFFCFGVALKAVVVLISALGGPGRSS